MTVVVDTSVLFPALVHDGPAGEAARAALYVDELIAPALIDVEILHGLRRKVRGGKLEMAIAAKAVANLRLMPLRRVDIVPLLERVWELRENVTAYDAAYVAVAEAYDAVLVTGDERLSKATGPTCQFKVVQPG